MAGESWYPPASEYWVDPEQSEEYPHRYGDVFATPDLPGCQDGKGKAWARVLALHPGCELGAKASDGTAALIGRVRPVAAIGSRQRPAVRLGLAEVGGLLRVAHANTFWMPPTPGQGDDSDWYCDFRRLVQVPLAELVNAGRIAAMTHDTRLALIRRELYFRHRWNVAVDDIRRLEAQRIVNDPDFKGPRPRWASSTA